MTKRWRTPTAKPGELKIAYGRVDRHEGPDLVYCYGGEGATKRDTNLLMNVIGSERMQFAFGEEARRLGRDWQFGPSLVKELEERGYDITTLKFSIQKKKETT